MRVYVEGYGCAQNLGETGAIRRQLVAAGHPVVDDPAAAEAGVLVTCGVVGATEARMLRRWRALGARLPRLVVTGCLVPLRTSRFDGPARERTTFLPIREQGRLPELLGAPTAADVDTGPSVAGPSVPVEEVVIAQGCTSRCAYCFSRLARGPLTSVPELDVLARVAAARDRGAVEVRLASLDTSCYGLDRPGGTRLPGLLRGVARLPGSFSVRVGMLSPQSLAPIAEEHFDALAEPRFFRFVHLPVQSGSDDVLAAMRRGYDVATFERLVARARRRLPDLLLATDVIVGHPGETDADFAATLRLLEAVEPEIVHVTRFSARPGTPSAREPPVPGSVVKARSRRLTAHRRAVARRRLERWIGREAVGLPVERGSGGSTVLRLPNYLPVVVDAPLPLGVRLPVRIDGARSTYLLGRPVG